MVQYPDHGTNTPYFIDIIQICLSAKSLDSDEIQDLYVHKGLSTSQIASRFKVSKTVILSRLHDLGIRESPISERMTNPKNYRCRVPPYGFSIQDGKLTPNRLEMKICRLVVELIQRDGRTQSEVARELSRRGYKNRAGNLNWDSRTVFNIFNRWKDKL
ncbi:MAG: hypothetical protein ACXVB4_17910 [Pseudobdellovibrionaceae bacterium]